MNHRLIIAQDGWGEVPEWVHALVVACDAPGSSQSKVAKQLGISGSALSQTLSGKYKGDLVRMEDRIRSIFLNDDVICPALGQTSARICLKYRDQAVQLTSSSPLRVQMFKACNACPRYRSQGR